MFPSWTYRRIDREWKRYASRLRVKSSGPSRETDRKIKEMLGIEDESYNSRLSTLPWLNLPYGIGMGFAALLVLVLSASLFFAFSEGYSPFTIASRLFHSCQPGEGRFFLNADEKTDHEWKDSGMALSSKESSILWSRGTTLMLEGPALVEALRRDSGCVQSLRIHYGSVTLLDTVNASGSEQDLSGAVHGQRVNLFQTDRFQYTKTGTSGRLQVSTTSETLQVLKGSFDVVGPAGARSSVSAGEKFQTSMKRSRVTPLSANEERKLKKHIETVRHIAEAGNLVNVKNHVSLPGPLLPPSLKVQKGEKRVTLTLRSGRTVQGYLRIEKELCYILTGDGGMEVFHVDAIAEIKAR